MAQKILLIAVEYCQTSFEMVRLWGFSPSESKWGRKIENVQHSFGWDAYSLRHVVLNYTSIVDYHSMDFIDHSWRSYLLWTGRTLIIENAGSFNSTCPMFDYWDPHKLCSIGCWSHPECYFSETNMCNYCTIFDCINFCKNSEFVWFNDCQTKLNNTAGWEFDRSYFVVILSRLFISQPTFVLVCSCRDILWLSANLIQNNPKTFWNLEFGIIFSGIEGKHLYNLSQGKRWKVVVGY